jgi:HlyD family secretion protein
MTEPLPNLDRDAPRSDVGPWRDPRLDPRAVITGVLFIAIIALAIRYLARPEPLLVQGEVESTRIDYADWRRRSR